MKNLQTAAILLAMCFASQASATLITSATDPSLNGSTLIDFNSETLGGFSSRTFNGDVTFNGSMNVETTYSGFYGSTGAYLGTSAGGSFDIVFANAVSAFGFSWGAADKSWTMNLFDASNVLIDTLSVTAQTSPYVGFIGANGGAISRVSMAPNGYDYILLDDFQYATASVPAPSALALIGLGLAGIRFSRRKKNA